MTDPIGLTEVFPEIYRSAASEAGRVRLVAGAITVNVVCLCLSLAFSGKTATGEGLFYSVLSIQAVVLLIYGAQRAAASVSRERADRTWDFQRLTPLTSAEIAAGKLLGAPLYAYFLAAAALPWAAASVVVLEGLDLGVAAKSYVLLGALVFLILNLSLLASAFTEAKDSGSVNAGGALLGFFGMSLLSALVPLVRVPGADIRVDFYGAEVSGVCFYAASGLVFGGWAFAGAKWRIGHDLLEERRAWRLPAFLLFLAAYVYGVARGPARGETLYWLPISALVVPTFFAYVGALLHREGLEHWRRWITDGAGRRLDDAPVWLPAWASLAAVALALAAGRPMGVHGRLLVLIPAFAGRDFAFLQWCRFTRSRRPETMALAFLALCYLLPALVLPAFKDFEALHFFLPFISKRAGFLGNVLPGLLQGAGMGAVVWAQARRAETPPPAA